MKNFGDLNVGDKVYCINNESSHYSPFITCVTSIEDEGDGTLCVECNGLKPIYPYDDESQGWEDNDCIDVFADKDEFSAVLTKKIEELTNFCLNEL